MMAAKVVKTIYCFAGLSGVGKTYTRTTDPKYKDLPYIDIADIYNEHPGYMPDQALYEFIERLRELLRKGESDVVLEAYFRPNSEQKFMVQSLAIQFGYKVKFIELIERREICQERINTQCDFELTLHPEQKEMIERSRKTRLWLLNKY